MTAFEARQQATTGRRLISLLRLCNLEQTFEKATCGDLSSMAKLIASEIGLIDVSAT
jgi:hypothetical protein